MATYTENDFFAEATATDSVTIVAVPVNIVSIKYLDGSTEKDFPPYMKCFYSSCFNNNKWLFSRKKTDFRGLLLDIKALSFKHLIPIFNLNLAQIG